MNFPMFLICQVIRLIAAFSNLRKTNSICQLRLGGAARLLPLLLLQVFPTAAHAQFTYTTSGGQVTITGYTGTPPAALTIPAMLGGNPVTGIGDSAFSNCTTVASVTIPAGVTSIGNSAFQGCSSLGSSNFMGAAPTTMGTHVFSNVANGFTVLFVNGAGGFATPTWLGYPTADISCTVSSGQVTITQCSGNAAMTVNIPAAITVSGSSVPVTGIGTWAFANNCPNLATVTIPGSVASVGDYAFFNCGNLTSLTISTGVGSIGTAAFYGCTGLAGITIPGSVTTIGRSAFFYCSGLKDVTIPNGVSAIGNTAFGNCYGLTSASIPASVTSIGQGPFVSCTSLASIAVDPSNPDYSSSADGVLFDRNKVTLIQCPAGKSGSYTIPAGVTTVASKALQFCANLTNVIVPGSVTSIGDYGFSNCVKLVSAVFTGNAPSSAVSSIFATAAPGFTVYYFHNAAGFASPTWTDSSGDGYPAVDVGAYSAVVPWLISYGLAYNANLQSTPNKDGVNLLLAYALNLNPNRNLSGSMPKPVEAGNQLSLTYYAGNADVTYTVESSTDLQTWSTSDVILSAPDANKFRNAAIPLTGRCRFLRLVVTH